MLWVVLCWDLVCGVQEQAEVSCELAQCTAKPFATLSVSVQNAASVSSITSTQAAAQGSLADLPHNCLVQMANINYHVTAVMSTVCKTLRAAALEARSCYFEYQESPRTIGHGQMMCWQL